MSLQNFTPALEGAFVSGSVSLVRERSTSQQHHLACLRPALPHTDCVTLSLDRRRILDRWDRSGLSASAFAPSVGVSPWTLYAWRQRTRGGRLACGSGDGRVPSTANVPAFVEISAIGDHAGDHEAITATPIRASHNGHTHSSVHRRSVSEAEAPTYSTSEATTAPSDPIRSR